MTTFQDIQNYINTVNEHKEILNEIKDSIVNEAFNSGAELKDWIQSFEFGRDNMMLPIPKITENECEICCTFYYLPQIVAKNSFTLLPRRFPLGPALPSSPINITWENGFPKLESNWKFELFPKPPVTICYRKNKPECRPQPRPQSCLTQQEYDRIIEEIKNNPPPERGGGNDPRFPLPPICIPNNEQPCPDEAKPKPGKSWLFRIYNPVKSRQYGQNCYWHLFYGVNCKAPIESNEPPIYYWGGWMVVNDGETFGDARRRYWQWNPRAERGGNSYSASINRLDEAPYFDSLIQIKYDIWWTKYEPITFDYEPSEEPPGNASPNPPINQEKQMECCQECLKILRKLDRDMTRLMKWTGASSDGVKFPEYIQNKEEQGWLDKAWDLITPDAMREIKSIPEFWKYSMEKMMEILGVPPYKVKDSKDNELGFPNISTLLTNQITKSIKLQEGIDLAHVALAKDLLETGLTRQQAIYATSLVNAICDWANIELRERQTPIKHQFAFPKDQDVSQEEVDSYKEFDEFLTTKDWNTKEAIFDSEKDLGNGKKPEHFGHTARRLLKILEILNSVHGIRIDPNNIEGSVRQFIKEYRSFSKGQALDGKVIGDDDTNDTSTWAKKVENEFSSEVNPPVGSTDNPWGNTNSERPRIIIRGVSPTEPDDME